LVQLPGDIYLSPDHIWLLHDSYIKFFTATILKWQNLLRPDKYKLIIVDSMNFLVDAYRLYIYGFVVVPNHRHILWQMSEEN